jgi:hypothetical protein
MLTVHHARSRVAARTVTPADAACVTDPAV